MNNITVMKAALIETVRANRETHRQMFLDAQVKYRERVIEELDARLLEARRPGGAINLGFRLPEPVDYTAEYDQALAMLEWEVSETVELDQTTFTELVLNQWRWAQHFAASTVTYLGEE
jgi:polysaccharide deacetylase 2 family uncharacterized protein YibQ